MKKWIIWSLLLALLMACNWSDYAPQAIGDDIATTTPAVASTPFTNSINTDVESNLAERAMVCTGYATGALNVRACPGIQCWAFFTLAEGRSVTLDGQTSQAEDGATWAHITQPVDGWVNGKYLCEVAP